MKQYKTLLFDIDDTLLDFTAAEDYALRSLFEKYDLVLTDELNHFYKKMNHQLWSSFEKGEIKKEQLLHSRFPLLFQQLGLTVDGVHLDNLYRHCLEQSAVLIDGAEQLIKQLANHYDLYIVTNGVARTQTIRLKNAGLTNYFKGVYISETIGYQKPMKEFFNRVFENIPKHVMDKTLIIGDSLSSDIQGGFNVGIDTCWFNPKSTKVSIQNPTYEIQHLTALIEILL